MNIFSIVITFIFGTIIGSFLNVVALRFNTGKGVNGRSACMSCNTQLTWKELVPMVSFLVQKGKCKKCESKISWQYPLIETLSGLIALGIIWYFPPTSAVVGFQTFLYLLVTCILLVITIYDTRHKIIPDMLSYTFAAISLVSLFVGGSSWWHVPPWSALAAGPLIALPFALIWLVSKGQWMGLGDAKLCLGIGWLLGIGEGVNAVVLSFYIAAVMSVTWLLLTRGKIKPRTEIPFGPYLIFGMYLVLLFGVEVIDISIIGYLFGFGV
jgi:prepilin signal peptidase PulO-like enzyme (type II secretory pathway)